MLLSKRLLAYKRWSAEPLLEPPHEAVLTDTRCVHGCLVVLTQIVWEQLKWLPTTIIFFNSVLFHMTEVCAIYFLGLPVVWGATSKVRH